jgi:hypothetical protein
MRLACGLAIALWLSFPAVGMASWQQDPASSANSAGQAPGPPAAPAGNARAENAPAEQAPAAPAPPGKSRTESAPAEQVPPAAPANPQTPAEGKKPSESVAKGKVDTGSATGTTKRRKRTAPAPDGTPQKIVVREGGAREPAAQIAPGMTPAEAIRQRQNAERLLGATDDKLKRLAGRTLDARQQETVGQIRNYMGGARSALKEGDLRRASTLAQKAHLLSEDLVKH